MRTRTLPTAVLAGVLALSVTACSGSSGSADGKDSAAGTSSSPSSSPAPEVESSRPGNGQLDLGYILAETGPLSGLGVGVIAATQLAVEDINAAGGVLGKPVTLSGGDEAGDPTVAGQTADRLLGEGVDAIIGPVSSAISLSVLDRITGAGAIQCAGSNTSKTFTGYPDKGLYFRTIPANIRQGPVLAQAVIGEGASRVAVVVRNDDYGQSLSQSLIEQLENEGAEVVANVPYDPAATTFSAEVAKVAAAKPDAVVVIAFQEGATLLRALIENGLGPDDVRVFGTDGMSLGSLGSAVSESDPGVLEGMQATQASSQNDPAFLDRLVASKPQVQITNFTPYHYDCVITIALAALEAGSDAPGDIARAMQSVTRDGEECTSFADCAKLISQGTDIDYNGVSGPLDFTDVGEPEVGLFDVVRFDGSGKPQIVRTVESR
ncbi:branched-chain amino acid transport system substrate-binding protein [Modestobacter sp. DSM 44400]|uniref:ABC transporter substrate-binding protein n=1 Tax=Modestobacter sp. DSM 44400 TaxID=1550230 RepID=UPI00089D64D8|nr:ABC transporter substrate-binding protein [Modestobacter sp. DSM 44400]SDY75052.1 branched-chain amino acid transport system substrate-binding protein [Modestobacter sp. DSM 44400]